MVHNVECEEFTYLYYFYGNYISYVMKFLQ